LKDIRFFHTHVSPEAIELVTEVLRSGQLSEGSMVQRFERALAEHLGLASPVALNSGTSALHLALCIAGVGPGDEVILPAQTFVATGLVVLMQRATPVFADIDPRTGNIDPASIRVRITARTKALIPVHWGGYPCDLDEINTLAREHGLAVIEDAAHALGATYKGKPIGSISRFTAFSFQAIKHLTTGDGGALCCTAAHDHERARVRRWFGIDRLNTTVSVLGERGYDINEIGFKYHMNDLAAALGVGNLGSFPERLRRRREIAGRYRDELADVAGLRLPPDAADRESAFWVFTLRVDERLRLIEKLRRANVPTSVVHQRIDRNSVFAAQRRELPGQQAFDVEQLALPLHEGLGDDHVAHIIRTIREGW
jgi:perosamine synthetase